MLSVLKVSYPGRTSLATRRLLPYLWSPSNLRLRSGSPGRSLSPSSLCVLLLSKTLVPTVVPTPVRSVNFPSSSRASSTMPVPPRITLCHGAPPQWTPMEITSPLATVPVDLAPHVPIPRTSVVKVRLVPPTLTVGPSTTVSPSAEATSVCALVLRLEPAAKARLARTTLTARPSAASLLSVLTTSVSMSAS